MASAAATASASASLASAGDAKTTAAAAVSTNVADTRYTFDETKLAELRKSCPWNQDPKYLNKVAISPSAITKMMMHCHSGVEKGIRKGGNPIEVMGILLGRPDPDTPKTLVVTDAFPLPIEGFETRVIADDADVINHMISLGECLEGSRREKFMGWYHSHPFDLGEHSHCFLSQTDLSTQLLWQRAEDPQGNPFVAIVMDPLRSLHKSNPELKAFRAYPPEHQSSIANECPDGSIVLSEQARLEQWGSCWNRYYELPVEYYMSSSARKVMEQLTQDYLWIRTLGTSPLAQPEEQARVVSALQDSANKLKTLDVSSSGKQSAGAVFGASTSSTSGSGDQSKGVLDKACQQVVDLASEELHEAAVNQTKQDIFGKP